MRKADATKVLRFYQRQLTIRAISVMIAYGRGRMREKQNLQANRLGCAEFRRRLAVDRRSFLKAGILGFAGLSLPDLLRVEAHAATAGRSGSREKSVIILWMRG